MTTPTLRRYVFGWLATMVIVSSSGFLIATAAYNLHEVRVEGHPAQDEVREFEVMLALGLIAFPFQLLLAWQVARRMIRPLHSLAEGARRIQQGALGERLDAKHQPEELALLAAAVNQALDRYQEAVDRLRHFASDVSHQLRNPLTTQRFVGELILQQERSPGEYREAVGQMLEESNRLSRLIDQLLKLARLDRAEIQSHFTRCDTAAMVQTVADLQRPVADARGLKLLVTAAPGRAVMGDSTLLQEAIGNLIDNALRHAPAGSEVLLSVRGGADGATILEVTDQGPGVPGNLRERLFRRFQRGDAADYEGTGLGLAVTDSIARAHRGRVELECPPTGGSIFRIVLPPA